MRTVSDQKPPEQQSGSDGDNQCPLCYALLAQLKETDKSQCSYCSLYILRIRLYRLLQEDGYLERRKCIEDDIEFINKYMDFTKQHYTDQKSMPWNVSHPRNVSRRQHRRPRPR